MYPTIFMIVKILWDRPHGIEEMAVMRELPERRIESIKRERVRVDCGSLIYVDRNIYSVPRRLIGERVDVHLSIDRVEVWYGQRKVADIPRLRGRRQHRVDYRHIIDWLVRKPGAFENYRYRDELFPTSRRSIFFQSAAEGEPARSTCTSWSLRHGRARLASISRADRNTTHCCMKDKSKNLSQ